MKLKYFAIFLENLKKICSKNAQSSVDRRLGKPRQNA